ncbi:RNA polymerase subunit sigma-70 [Actinoalloteichus sp. AHMU CJ021]|uniref:RNA polymerase sigma-70 factor, ECF subfamily n=1 Tax=Actinoalloteichus caeruleus DSM 43889 TaxID=1120930 RepID=A0ABT1JLD2_ACTCY|nr:sigma-70 family RNA polymerase sigma factor [Actinoalloteichus caeruleus]AUS79082.1 RNA polymerase subunit sigma-70 [Actinoalloteichus sp. AHMU CJ021]MCP2333323.1 RNA polymerase sigma-70 factor, ECF subfamily [Actinoalloteichus caeruleus DSM 43889]
MSTTRAEGWSLVRAAQRGDPTAFAELYRTHVDVVFRYALLRTGDRELAEDVTSETFLRALRRISSLRERGRDVGAWFVTIARNLVLDHVRSGQYRMEVPVARPEDGPLSASLPVQAGPEQKVLTEAVHSELLRHLGRLGTDQRECVVLRFLGGLSVAETAARMGRNEGAVKALQQRAVRRLARMLPEGLR